MKMSNPRTSAFLFFLLLALTASSCTQGGDRQGGNRQGGGPQGGERRGGGRGGRGSPVEAAGNSGKPVPVQLAALKQQQVQRMVEAVGSLVAFEEVVVSSEVEGKVADVLAGLGDRVEEGQVLVQIAPAELQLATEQQRAALDQVRARLGLSDGETTLRDIRDAAGVKKAAADLSEAEQKYQRAKDLFDQGLVPRQSYEEAESRYKSMQANYDLALQDVRNLLAVLKQYTATSELASKKLQDTEIKAPLAGYVKGKAISQGEYVRVQTALITIVRVNPLKAIINIPEKMAGWVTVGRPVTISVEAYPDRKFTGRIARMNPTVDPETRSFVAVGHVDNNEGLLKPGFFLRASIPSNRVENLLTIPQRALNYTYGVYSVYVLKGNQAEQREVKIGDRLADDVEILAGLSEGDQVAIPVNPGQQLYNGAPVEVAP